MARLAHYELGPLIGRGTQGEVHSATDTRTGARVAIKLLPWPRSSSATERTESLERFRREVAVTESLSHPAIARVADSGSSADGLWIAMELLNGTPLSDFCVPGRLLEPRQVVRVVTAAADVLAHVHARGVVHRDVTPANLVLLGSGDVKLLDFGVARILDSSLTNTGEFLGTPQTISPEQLEGKKPGPAADQYALAATTFHLFTGRWPFEGRDPGEIFEAALSGRPSRSHGIGPSCRRPSGGAWNVRSPGIRMRGLPTFASLRRDSRAPFRKRRSASRATTRLRS